MVRLHGKRSTEGEHLHGCPCKTCGRGRSVRVPPPPPRPRRAGPVGGNPTSVPGRVRRDRLESRYLELDLRHRSEEHTSELQSRSDLVCRLLLEKKKQTPRPRDPRPNIT